jgi:RimJ/RimL family protein N-acetyltransferase
MAVPQELETLETPRLTLRPAGERDLASITAWWNDPTVRRMHGLGLEPLPEAAVRRWLDVPTRALAWVARRREDDGAVGVIEMSPREARGASGGAPLFELGIALDAAARGQGLGREMIECLCAWAFGRRGAQAVLAEVRQDNAPALRAFAACGFSVEAVASGVVRMRRRGAGDS